MRNMKPSRKWEHECPNCKGKGYITLFDKHGLNLNVMNVKGHGK